MKWMHHPSSRSGFTLLEMLVVVVIVGIVFTFIQLNLGQNQSRQVEAEARRLFRLMQLASEESVLESKEMGLRLSDTEYNFFIWNADNRSWAPITEDKVFHPESFDPDTEVALFMEGDAVKMASDPNSEKENDEEANSPQILFLSSGEISPFQLELYGAYEKDKYKMTGSFTGGGAERVRVGAGKPTSVPTVTLKAKP